MSSKTATKSEQAKYNERRKKSIDDANKNKDYYNIRRLVNTDAHICLAIGQRSNGKTWSSLDYVLDMYHRYGYRFVYVRRWAEDISKRTMDELFSKSDLEKYFGPDAKIKHQSGEFLLYTNPDSEPEVIGFTAALAQVAHTKGRNFPNARTIIYDEFLAMLTERSLNGELDAWNQTISTIFRTEPTEDLMKDRKIIMLGNTVTKYSPYFKLYGIEAKKLKQGEIYEVNLLNPNTNKTTRIKCEYCKYNPRVGEATSVFTVGSTMAVTGEFEVSSVPTIPQTDGEDYNESMLMSMFDPTMDILVGMYVRRSYWYTWESNEIGMMTKVQHRREFLVIRPTLSPSSYYHLTTIQDLSYGSWNHLHDMLADIKENTGIDIKNEIRHGRVFSEDEFIAENFIQCWKLYDNYGIDKALTERR